MGRDEVDAAKDVALASPLAHAAPGCVFAMEGTNEYDFWHYKLGGEDSYQNYGEWGPNDARQLEAAMYQDDALKDCERVSPSVQQIAKMPRSYGDSITGSNSHAYNPEQGGNVQHHIRAGIDYAQTYAPGLPVYITETGMSSGGYTNGGYSCGTEHTQMIVVMNCALEGFYNGAACTYIYELTNWTGAGGSTENNFGLFHADGTPKPAAVALGNLMAILKSPTAALNPDGLDIEISGLPDTASALLLQKGDGTFAIVLWNGGARISDGGQDIDVEPVEVTVSFADIIARVNVYDPVQGTAPRSSANNVAAVATMLAATPIVIEIPASVTVVSTGASDTFTYA
jgi:hypothetical protein